MKKALKILAAVIAVLAIAVIGLTFFIKSYLTDERIRALIAEAAEKSIGRKVTIGAIQVSLWSGITVSDLAVNEKDSEQAFLSAKDFVLKYQLLPLLSKQLVIDELRLEGAALRIRKHPDGTFNFSDMAKPKEGDKKAKAPSSGLPVSMSVRSVVLKDATVDYQDPSGTLKKASLTIDATLGVQSKSSDVIASKGKVSVAAKELVIKDQEKPVRDVSAAAGYDIEADTKAKKVMLRTVDVQAFKVPAKITGDLSYADPASFSLTISVPEVNLASLKELISRFAPEGAALSGSVSMNLTVMKKAEKEGKPTFNGKLALKDVSVSHKGMQPVLNGTVGFTPERISLENFLLKTGENSAAITGSVAHYTTLPDIRVDVKSSMLNLDALVPAPQSGPAEGTQAKGGSPERAQEKEIEPMKLKMKATGTVDIQKALYRGVTLKDLKAAFDLNDNVFRLLSLSGATMNGTFSGQATVDLGQRGTRYSGSTSINGVKIEEIIAAFAPKQKDTLYGALYAKADISGAGTLKDTMRRNLQGRGNFSIKDGVYKNTKISDNMLLFLGLQEIKEIRMQKADGNFTITNGIMNLTSLVESKDLIIDEKGLVGLPDESLDIALGVKTSDKLTPKMLRQPSVAQFLSEEKGWSTLPLRLGGTFSNPTYSIDTRQIGKKAGEKAQKKLEDELMKTLSGDKKKKGQQQQPQTQQQQPQTQQQQQPSQQQPSQEKKKKKNPLDDIFGK